MNSDSHFMIGSSHKVCQDYAISNKRILDHNDPNYGGINDDPFCIVTDGCSTAPDTDFGSRLIAKAAEAYLDKTPAAIAAGVAAYAHTYARAMNLDTASLSATLLMARIKNGIYKVTAFGDGVVVVKQKNQCLIRHIDFVSGAPYYLRYEIADKDRYFEQFGNKVLINDYVLTGSEVKKTTTECTLTPDNFYFHWEWQNDVEFVALFSDGVCSFQKTIQTNTSKSPEPVSLVEAVSELISFKRTNGEFVLRWMNRCSKEFKKNNWQHTDDLSMGVITSV